MIDPSQMPGSPQGSTAASFPQSQPIDRSAPGLAYQAFTVNKRASGQGSLGIGRRFVPDASSLFSQPTEVTFHPLSAGQFGGGHAKSLMSQEY